MEFSYIEEAAGKTFVGYFIHVLQILNLSTFN